MEVIKDPLTTILKGTFLWIYSKRQGHQQNYSLKFFPTQNESFIRGHAAQASVTATPCRGETLEVTRGTWKTAAGDIGAKRETLGVQINWDLLLETEALLLLHLTFSKRHLTQLLLVSVVSLFSKLCGKDAYPNRYIQTIAAYPHECLLRICKQKQQFFW